MYTLFVDFSKAFDYVVRENLWFKLVKCGVKGKILNVIMSMYHCIKNKVFYNGEKSDSYECKLGVRQGDCLSPFLFAVYVNDMEQCLDNENAGVTIADVKILLLFYADDLVLFSETAEGLQSEINKLADYCDRWKLTINTGKSKIVVFRKGNRPINFAWYFNNTTLNVTNRIPYLGIIVSSNGSFFQTQKTLASQADKALFMLRKRLQIFYNITPEHMMNLFDKFITPILSYGCEIWGFHPSPDIEKFHLSFCKRILCVKKSTQNDFIYGELGRYPLQMTRYGRIIRYWLNIVTGKKSLYVCLVYREAVAQADRNKSSWALNVKSLLCSIGLGEAWYNQGVGDPDIFIRLFKQRLRDIFTQDWRSRLESSPRARFYRDIKENFGLSFYLDNVTVKQHSLIGTASGK